MQFELKQYNDAIRLVHLTTEDRIDSIKNHGLLASEYGDLPVGDNDGAGIYAIKFQEDAVKSLRQQYFSFFDERIFAVCFDYYGPYYECEGPDSEEFDEDFSDKFDENDHKGFIVIPWHNNESRLRIDSKDFITVVPVEDLFKTINKPSLDNQIQSASSRATRSQSVSSMKAKEPEPEF